MDEILSLFLKKLHYIVILSLFLTNLQPVNLTVGLKSCQEHTNVIVALTVHKSGVISLYLTCPGTSQ